MSDTMHDYVLSCGHSYSQFRLLLAGERPYCEYCGAFRRTAFLIGEVRLHCEVCNYTRRCGFARLAAESAAAAHATRKQHTVSLQRMELWGPETLHTFDHHGKSDIELPFRQYAAVTPIGRLSIDRVKGNTERNLQCSSLQRP